jgi:hypothetical protein
MRADEGRASFNLDRFGCSCPADSEDSHDVAACLG